MQIFFIDESGTLPPPDKVDNAPTFALGGLVIPEDLWHEIDKELARLKAQYSVVGEIKWRFFAPTRPEHKTTPLSHLSAQEKENLRNALYEIISKYKSVRIISAVVDVRKAYALSYVNTVQDLYWYAYKQMTERFQYYLQDLSRTVGSKINGIIICDHRQPQDDQQLRILHHRLLTGSKNSFSTYENLIEGVFIAPSDLSVGIQLADMVGGAIFRKYARNDERYFQKIESSFRRSATGRLEGYGLVRWPK
ncbi:MAG: DUF3800 domain-containing protein [Alphaproteobacteria bacterium]